MLDAFRHLCLDPVGQVRPSGRRRMPGGARALRAAGVPLRKMTESLDPRVTPARPDMAAIHLAGRVTAARYVEGESRIVIDPQAPLRRAPSPDAALDTEALMGERVTV